MAELCIHAGGMRVACAPVGDSGNNIYVMGADVEWALRALREAAKACEYQVTKVVKKKVYAEGTPSNIASDIILFQLSAYLSSLGSYTKVKSLWTANTPQVKRVALSLSVQLADDGEVTIVLGRPAQVTGGLAVTAAKLVSGTNLWALPSSTSVQVVDVVKSMEPTEPFGKKDALQRYWTATHGIAAHDLQGSLFVRTTFQGAGKKVFTYPSRALLATPLDVQNLTQGHGEDYIKEAQRAQVAELRTKMFRDIEQFPWFKAITKSKKEED